MGERISRRERVTVRNDCLGYRSNCMCLVCVQVQIMPALPLILFGTMGMVAGILSLIFPETLGTKLPDTVWEAENIGKVQLQRDPQDSRS